MSDNSNENMAINGDHRVNTAANVEGVVKEDSEERILGPSNARSSTDNQNAPKMKKSGFKITSVTKKVADTDKNPDNDGDGIDDILDESHTEDITSELYDNSKMTDCDHDSIPDDTLHNLTPDDNIKDKIIDGGGPSRFKVVKIETKEPFKRGRWECHDFLDPSVDKEKSEVIKPVEESHSGNSSGSSSIHYIQGVDDPSKNPLICNAQVPGQVVSSNLVNQAVDTSVKGHTVHTNAGAQQSVINTTEYQPVLPVNQKLNTSQTSNANTTTGQLTLRIETPPVISQSSHNSTSTSSQLPPITPSLLANINTQQENSNIMTPTPALPLASNNQQSQRSTLISQTVPNTPQPKSAMNLPSMNAMQLTNSAYNSSNMASPMTEQKILSGTTPNSSTSNPVLVGISDQYNNSLQNTRKVSASASIPDKVPEINSESVQTSTPPNIQTTSADIAYQLDTVANSIDTSNLNVSTDIGNGDSIRQDIPKIPDKIDTVSVIERLPQELGISGVGLLTPLAAAVDNLASSRNDSIESGATSVTIDNRIEQAMDLVKSHLKFAVREEVEVLKEQIVDLVKKNTQLEQENNILKAGASQETLSKLSQSRASSNQST